MAVNIQQAYAGGDGDSDSSADASAAAPQDLTIPGQVAAQLAQLVQAGDCQSVLKLLADALSGGASAPPAQ